MYTGWLHTSISSNIDRDCEGEGWSCGTWCVRVGGCGCVSASACVWVYVVAYTCVVGDLNKAVVYFVTCYQVLICSPSVIFSMQSPCPLHTQ